MTASGHVQVSPSLPLCFIFFESYSVFCSVFFLMEIFFVRQGRMNFGTCSRVIKIRISRDFEHK